MDEEPSGHRWTAPMQCVGSGSVWLFRSGALLFTLERSKSGAYKNNPRILCN